MPTWCFKAAARRTRTSAPRWYWQIDTNHSMISIASTQLFDSLDECIANARSNGFLGEVEVPSTTDESSVITCEQGDHVHAIVQQSMRDRANRAA